MKNNFLLLLLAILTLNISCTDKSSSVHVFDIYEVTLHAENLYKNPYSEVESWVKLTGPNFDKKVYGFWNGSNEFVYRLAATEPGEWKWTSFSNQPDNGLNGKSGSFIAKKWHNNELTENPNRRGFIRATENGHALEYADGTPFFMVGDTWWAASTWRFPLKGIEPDATWKPNEQISFENALHFRKNQGYNTIAMIAAYPNWNTDKYPAQYKNKDGIGVRQAWEKNGQNTAKEMHDEFGNRPFAMWEKSDVIADYDRINPEYFKSFDKKMDYLNDQGFIAFLEVVRRDHGPTWKTYFDWPESYSRYVQYMIARYGAYNIMFSGIHLDWIANDFCLHEDEFNEVLTYHYKKYGGLPYGQPHTILIDESTFERFGHGDEAPWLTMHSVGNNPRNHGFYPMIETQFNLDPPYPTANLEPYYPGWNHDYHNTVAGEKPAPNSDRDNYFGRAQMYGSVLSGGLAGHIYGTGAYCGNTTGEKRHPGERPSIWDGLNYPSGAQMEFLAKFILSEGKTYQNCTPQKEMLVPHKIKGAPEQGLDGWAFMLFSDDENMGFVYFENKCEISKIVDLEPNNDYEVRWFDPKTGEWVKAETLETDSNGTLYLNHFPDKKTTSSRDWALKIKKSL